MASSHLFRISPSYSLGLRQFTAGSIGYLIFWAVVFLLNLGPDWHKYSSSREVLEVTGLMTLLQGIVAFVALRFLAPVLLDRGAVVKFSVALFGVLLAAAELNILISYFYLEGRYPNSYGAYYLKYLHDKTLMERLGFSYLIKYILLSKVPEILFPAAVLIGVDYYRKRRREMEVLERQKNAELAALKNQLNPHFIFNTLNNIYALAVKKSEKTSEAIVTLAHIFDYVLYRCGRTFVPVNDEVDMIKNYIELERLRFGERLTVTLDCEINNTMEVPPLLFLTLVENAFKHGPSQSLESVVIDIKIAVCANKMRFTISNSCVPSKTEACSQNSAIGLANLNRQLEVIYPDRYFFEASENNGRFIADLVISGV